MEWFVQLCIITEGQFGFVDLVQDVVGIGKELLSLSGERDMFADSVKQFCVQVFFQKTDLHGDCRLGISKIFRCFGKTLELDHFDKCNKLTNFHLYFNSSY